MQFGFIGAATLFASLMILLYDDPVILALMPPATVSILVVASIGLMKLANRRAQEQVAAGGLVNFSRIQDKTRAP